MLILAIDTSTRSGSLAVLRDAEILGVVSEWRGEPYSSALFEQTESLLQRLRIGLKQMDLFAVAAGPGSFTGLRVGLTAVKGWAEVYGKPIAAVSGLEAVAAQAKQEDSLLAPVLDARRGQVFGALYECGGGKLNREGDEVVMTPTEYLAWLEEKIRERPVTFVTPTPEVIGEAVGASRFAGGQIEKVSAVLAPIIGQLGLARARRGELVDALTLDANYVRRSDAELFWKEPQ